MALIKKKTVPDPLFVGTTLLPKRPLSYRWVCKDAKPLLDNAVECISPVFSVSLPLKTDSTDHQHQTSSWYFKACKFKKSVWDTKLTIKDVAYIEIKLCYCSKSTTNSECTCKVLLSEGTIYIVNSEMEPFGIDNRNIKLRDGNEVSIFDFPYSSITKYLHNGTLTIQVDATSSALLH